MPSPEQGRCQVPSRGLGRGPGAAAGKRIPSGAAGAGRPFPIQGAAILRPMTPPDDRAPGAVVLDLALGLWAVGLGSCLGLGLLGALHWGLDLLNHFQVQYAGLAVAGLLAAVLARRPRLAAAFLVLASVTALRLLPLLREAGPAPAEGARPTRVLALNCLTANRDVARVTGWIQREAPGVAVLLELDERWMAGLERTLEGYRRVPTATARADNFGLGVYVREGLTWRGTQVHHTERGLPWIEVVVDAPAGPLRVFAVHTIPPMAADPFAQRNRQLAEVTARAAASAEPAVVAGDLNATLWSRGLRDALEGSRLRPASHGHGLRGTWPARLAFTGGLLIDHVLVDARLAVLDHRVGPPVGSDHLGVVVDVAAAAAP